MTGPLLRRKPLDDPQWVRVIMIARSGGRGSSVTALPHSW